MYIYTYIYRYIYIYIQTHIVWKCNDLFQFASHCVAMVNSTASATSALSWPVLRGQTKHRVRLKGQGQVYGPRLANLAGKFLYVPDILFELVEARNVKLEHHPRWELRCDQRNGRSAPVRGQ